MPHFRLFAASVLTLALPLHLAHAQCNGSWTPGGLNIGFDSKVIATTVWDPDGPGPLPDELVVAGGFTIGGDLPSPCIAAWDGATWHTLGDGVSGTVRALTVHNGQLIIAGDFHTTGAHAATGIARLTGGAWEPMGTAFTTGFSALAAIGPDLYAAVNLATPAGYSRVLHWTGADWEPLSDGFPGGLRGLTEFQGNLVKAGGFGVDIWNAQSQAWSILGTLQYVRSIAVWNGQLIAGCSAEFDDPVIWRWDGAMWQPMSTGIIAPFQQSMVNALGVYQGSLLAAGELEVLPSSYYLLRWSGSQWGGISNTPGQWTPYQIATIAPEFHARLFVGGNFDRAASLVTNYLARYDGQSWSRATPMPIIGAGAPGSNHPSVYAVIPFGAGFVIGGVFTIDTQFGPATNVALWDGAAWRPMGQSLTSTWCCDQVKALTIYQNQLVAAGEFAQWSQTTGAARWDGQLWQPMGNAILLSLAEYGGELFAGQDGYGVSRWNGSSWVTVGGASSGTVRALTVHRGELIAAGQFTSLGSTTTPNIAGWDGSQWHALGDGLSFGANALTVYGDRLVAAGLPGASTAHVASWDGVSWSDWPGAAGSGPATINALAAAGDDLFAAGHFSAFAGLPANSIARWDGAAWHFMGAGLTKPSFSFGASVYALAVRPHDLIAAGDFTTADSQPSPFVALWGPRSCYANCDCSTSPPYLTPTDFMCFLGRFAAKDPYANCDGSSFAPVLNVNDFICFLNKYAAGCP